MNKLVAATAAIDKAKAVTVAGPALPAKDVPKKGDAETRRREEGNEDAKEKPKLAKPTGRPPNAKCQQGVKRD
jgi:hypothetical protein